MHRFRLHTGEQDGLTGVTGSVNGPMESGGKGTVEESFTAGLLHDIGRLVLVTNLPEQYLEACNRAKAEGIALVEAERAVFGASHAEVGGYLLGLWGLPISLVEAAVYHHYPGRCQLKAFTPLTTVHIANALVQEDEATWRSFSSPEMDQEYLTEIGVWNRIPNWREAVAGGRISETIS